MIYPPANRNPNRPSKSLVFSIFTALMQEIVNHHPISPNDPTMSNFTYCTIPMKLTILLTAPCAEILTWHNSMTQPCLLIRTISFSNYTFFDRLEKLLQLFIYLLHIYLYPNQVARITRL